MVRDTWSQFSSIISSRYSNQVINLTVRNWDEVYEDLSKRLKVKPQGVQMSKHLKMAGQPSSCLLPQYFALCCRNVVQNGIRYQGRTRREGQGHLPGASKLTPLYLHDIDHKHNVGHKVKKCYHIICDCFSSMLGLSDSHHVKPLSSPWLFRGTSRGKRRRKRRCRRMFSRSGARIADTDAFSRLDTELSCLTKYVMMQNFKEAIALSELPWFEVKKWRCQEVHLPRGRRFTSKKKMCSHLTRLNMPSRSLEC